VATILDIDYFLPLLSACPGKPLTATLVHRTPYGALAGLPPDLLFTSRLSHRYNLAGSACTYWSADETTTQWEFEDGVDPVLTDPLDPVLLHHAKVHLVERPVLDLLDKNVLDTLGLGEEELFDDWRKNEPVATQYLGAAVEAANAFSAIRYPSAPAHRRGETRANVAIFRACVLAPDWVQVIWRGGPIMRWP